MAPRTPRRGMRLTAPTIPVFILALLLAALSLASLHWAVPYVGPHRYWVMTAAFVVMTIGVVFDGL